MDRGKKETAPQDDSKSSEREVEFGKALEQANGRESELEKALGQANDELAKALEHARQ
eukprot:TRINITY_DN13175_c0_g1_i1.p3 TRINITY_DN13175_c0_g1~~TRINITY_DN13175_c0_g1_i1.p3  ORF type:complete len:58 (+),score=21.24 TRINITY_DN13175_c0_g1_i1:240-413(+)